MFNKLINLLLKQNEPGYTIGAAKNLVGQVLFYASPFNMLLILVTAYHTTLSVWFPWLHLFIFFLAILMLSLIAFIFEWKVMMPSAMKFSNQQSAIHGNFILKEIAKIDARQKEFEKEVLLRLKELQK